MDGPAGLPREAWLGLAAVALLASAVFAAGVGVPRARPAGLIGIVLRWGHAGVWVLLAALFAGLWAGVGWAAQPLGLMAGATYAAFLAALIQAGRARPR